MFEIGQENDFLLSKAERMPQRYPKILVVPLLYRGEDQQLYRLKGLDGALIGRDKRAQQRNSIVIGGHAAQYGHRC